jgi:hypothetical protein
MEKQFVEYVTDIIKKIQKFVDETQTILALKSPELIGRIADNNNIIDERLNKFNQTDNINKLVCIYDIKKHLFDSINELKSKNILADAVINRSFTYVDDIKKIYNSIINSVDDVEKYYKELNDSIIKLLDITTQEKADILFDKIVALNNTNIITAILFNVVPNSKFFASPKVKKTINDIIKETIDIKLEFTDIAKILTTTYPTDAEFNGPINLPVDKKNISSADNKNISSVDNMISINTGNIIYYNLQGMVDANWVGKNKLNVAKNSGLNIQTIKRLTTISDTQISDYVEGGDENTNHDRYITYGGQVYKLLYLPPDNIQEISYAIILADHIAGKIILNPPNLEMDIKKDESIKDGIMLRIKSNVAAELKNLLKVTPDSANIKDLIKLIVKTCAVGIKNSVIVTNKDMDSLLINMAALTDMYKRVDNSFRNLLNERFPNIESAELIKKNDFKEIIMSLTNKALDDINRQPSVLDQLL